MYVAVSSPSLTSASGGITITGTVSTGALIQLVGTSSGIYTLNNGSGTRLSTTPVVLGALSFTYSGGSYAISSLVNQSVQYLIVGGGGAGGLTGCDGCSNGGGGGGGGAVSTGTASLNIGSGYSAVIGAGGSSNGANGGSSSSFGVTAGGGFGGAMNRSTNTGGLGGDAGGTGGGAGGRGGWNPCERKYGSKYGIGKLADRVSGKPFCNGSKVIPCKPCKATGRIGTLVYLNTNVGVIAGEFYKYTKQRIEQIEKKPELLYPYLNKNEVQPRTIFTDINGNLTDNYDDFSSGFFIFKNQKLAS
jgi:hypothetical protein